jgi:hypothetical protein
VAIDHNKVITAADFTGTVTVFGSNGSTQTMAATDMVLPSNWNSVHDITQNLLGNTAGTSQVQVANGGDLYWAGGNNITMSAVGSTISVNGPDGYTQLTYQNRQLGASATTSGQNTVWLAPFRLVAPVSASTIMQIMSIAGASSSNTGSVGITQVFGLYKVTQTTNLSRFDTIWTGAYSMTGYISSSNSAAFTINGGASGQNLTTASANSNLLSQISGVRMLTFNLNSVLGAGLYAYGMAISTSSVGNSAAFRSYLPVGDAPLASAMGFGFGGNTNASIGYVDGGSYSATSAAMPVSFVFSQIQQTNNYMPYVKLGAI